MKLQLKAFGVAREVMGGPVVEWPFTGRTVGDLKSALYTRYPQLTDLRSLQIAVNQTFADDHQPIAETDEIALIPPMNGG
jgi:molybdopterin synthase sulfur carrier subunit